jgi:hypothetical protein
MKQILLSCLLMAAFAAQAAHADEAAMCSAAAGVYRTGTVVKAPKFSHGQFRKGVELSHTHIRMKADQDGKEYDVAIDNVFASGFEPNQKTVPGSLSGIRVNDRVEACGQLYTHGGVGIHWVHTNCGKKPKPSKPDGWIKMIAADGTPGQNIESNTQYCSLFN